MSVTSFEELAARSRARAAAPKLGPRNYYKTVTGALVERNLREELTFFASDDAQAGATAYTHALAAAPAACALSVFARTPGVPAHVPLVGDAEAGVAS